MDAIKKTAADLRVAPNLRDYAQACATFSWEDARRELDGLPGRQGINIAYEAVDRHVNAGRGDRMAIRWLGKSGARREVTYVVLSALTNRFANVLHELGVVAGDRVYALTGRIPELYISALGSLKNRCVFCPLFSAFGPEPLRARLTIGGASVLVTTESLYRRKIEPMRRELPTLKYVLLVGDGTDKSQISGTLGYGALLDGASEQFTIPPTDGEDRALLHFTSGTTGTPKGAVHVHDAVVAHYATGKLALDLHPDDIFWCTADPGRVTGTSYGIIAPLGRTLRG